MDETKATTRACKVCGVTKPLDDEHFRAHRKPHGVVYERRCKACDRAAARERMRQRYATDEGRRAARRSIEDWKRRNPGKVQEYRRRDAERAGREYSGPRQQEAFNRAQDRLALRNAREAWRYWMAERAPDWWVARYWEAAGTPWRNPRTTQAERLRIRYREDADFRRREQVRLRSKKVRRRQGRKVSDDGTVTARSVGRRATCVYCARKLTEDNRTLDHMDPLNRGGAHSASNMVECCRSCNSRKSDMAFHEWVDTLSECNANRARREYERRRGAPMGQVGLPLG